MEWTKIHPKKAGFYWVKFEGKKMIAYLHFPKDSKKSEPMWFYTEQGMYETPEEFFGPLKAPPGKAGKV